jgi:predicted nucleic acid-binding Zn ribbon protein
MRQKSTKATKIATEPQSRRCVACCKPIELGASKCTECGTYQNWRRHLDFGATVLSLLVAVISVTGLVVPILLRAFQEERSNVQVSLRGIKIVPWESVGVVGGDTIRVDTYGVEVNLLFSNTGDKPGFVDSATLSLAGDKGPIGEARLGISPEDSLVKPGTFSIINIRSKLKLAGPNTLPVGEIDQNQPPRVTITTANLLVRVLQNDLTAADIRLKGPSGSWQIEP